MSTTVPAHPRPGVRSSHAPLVTLGSRQFTVLVVVLLLFATLFLILLSPFITRHLARIDVQAHEQAFGFRLGLVDEGQIQDWHIVEVTPGGRFAQAGFRAGDVPTRSPRERHRRAALGARRGGQRPPRLRDGLERRPVRRAARGVPGRRQSERLTFQLIRRKLCTPDATPPAPGGAPSSDRSQR